MTGSGWQFWIDRGGTFTDIVARRPEGGLVTLKLLSEASDQHENAAIEGMRRLLGIDEHAPFPTEGVDSIKMGTTVATNALLERRGEPLVLVITKGFADALVIAQQNRPRLFDLRIVRPAPLHARVIEVDERIAADGSVVTPLDDAELQAAFTTARSEGFGAIAIVFLHGYCFPAHEARAAALARSAGFTQVSVSHEISPLVKVVPRGQTTVADAYLSPVLSRYVAEISSLVGKVPLYFMQSSGGLTTAGSFRGKDAILSGPAGGVVGAVETARAAGAERIIGFDMGGTSTDVSHYREAYERSFDAEVAGVRLQVPMMAIHTVAAGGGSICRFDGLRFLVGPESAGAHPGPVCYRKDGLLAVTDCNVFLGKLQPDYFPAVFGPEGNQPLDAQAVAQTFTKLAQEVGKPAEDVAEGFLTVAVEHMVRAIKKITVERGHDVTTYTLVVFGGAGGQHGCLVADALGIERVLIHPMAGVLSALGMGLADLREIQEQALDVPLEDEAVITAALDALEDNARARLVAQGVQEIKVLRRVHAKYRGADAPLLIPFESMSQARTAFEDAHRRAFGFTEPGCEVVAEAASVEAITPGDRCGLVLEATSGSHTPLAMRRIYSGGKWHAAPVFRRADLMLDKPVIGPAILLEETATTIVEPGWQAMRVVHGNLLLTRSIPRPRRRIAGTEVDPVLLEVFNNLFMSVAEQMGVVLERTAHSVNMKERLDFSCAVFDAEGNLIANAPHMPIHLGSMGESVKAVITAFGDDLDPGDSVMMNDPFNGGTHLPDVTVVTPVCLNDCGKPDFFVAARGHHADIGGISPGSMPSASRTIEEEGVLIPPMKIVEGGRFLDEEVRACLRSSRHPARNSDQNIADLKAQLAANEKGVAEVKRLIGEFGRQAVAAYMGHVRANAEESVRRVLDRMENGTATYPMDCGAIIRVRIRVDRALRRATIDFTGTSGQHRGNFNAPRSITRAAVLYVFRCLVGEDIPLNDGCLAPLNIILPEGSILDPGPGAAVVAGNVETSQAVTNALFLATGALAAAQGTMNNLSFGNAWLQYYETICGGAGAGDGFDGAFAVQTHMTNSRITDAEVLENRYPVRVERFAVRTGSGGAGKWRGGDGVVRDIRFLEAMDVNILSGHRHIPPPGLMGALPGVTGRNYILRANGHEDALDGADAAQLDPGDRLVMETPGGGGFGAP